MVNTGDEQLLSNNMLLTAYFSDNTLKNMKVVPFLKRNQTDADIVNLYHKDKKALDSIINSQSGKPRRITEGSKLTQVRATAKDSKGRTLNQFGLEYFVTKKRLRQPGYSLQEDLKDLSAFMANTIEGDVVERLKAEATAPKPSAPFKKWNDNDKTIDHIQSDMIDYDVAYDDDQLMYELNTIFHSKLGMAALRKKININVQNWTIPLEGFDSQKALTFAQINNVYGGKYLSSGEILGWDINRPAAQIYYGVEEGVTETEVYEDLPEYAPMINTFVEEIGGVNPEYKIQLSASWALVTREPLGILYDTGLV